jgi:hypothetical protein
LGWDLGSGEWGGIVNNGVFERVIGCRNKRRS